MKIIVDNNGVDNDGCDDDDHHHDYDHDVIKLMASPGLETSTLWRMGTERQLSLR